MAHAVEQMDAVLESIGARAQAEVKAPAGGTLTFYRTAKGNVFIFQQFGHGHGWEIHAPICQSNDVRETLRRLAEL